MIRLLHGKNEFAIAEEVVALRSTLGMSDGSDADFNEVEGVQLDPQTLLEWCLALPFMSPKRLIVVHGLFGINSKQKEWRDCVPLFAKVPPTTELVFTEKQTVPHTNALLRLFKNLIKPQLFEIPRNERLVKWVLDRFKRYSAKVEASAAHYLAELIGGRLRLLDREVEKLATYADGRVVVKKDVELLVTEVREANLFAVMDAVVEGRLDFALDRLKPLVEGGESFSSFTARFAAHLRRLAKASYLRQQGIKPSDIAEQLGIRHDFILRRTMRQALATDVKETLAKMGTLHRLDLAFKTGKVSEGGAFHMAIIGEGRDDR